jgi:hypothetical protein
MFPHPNTCSCFQNAFEMATFLWSLVSTFLICRIRFIVWHYHKQISDKVCIYVIYLFLICIKITVKLLPCDNEVVGSSLGNNLFQKCREKLRT